MDTRKRGRLELGFNSNGGFKKSKQGLILSFFGFLGFGIFLRFGLLGFKSCLPLFSLLCALWGVL